MTEKPSHISKAVGDAMNSVQKPESGPSTKAKPEAASSRSAPPKTPDSVPVAQRSPDEPPPATEPQPTRSPGRPRSNRIESFNTDSFMRQNKKFIKFRRKLKISEEKAWTIITSMLCYVAQSEALTPTIDDAELFAEFCYWDDEPEILINALISVNFLSETLEITNWFQNQPHAARKLHSYRYYESKKEQELDDDPNGSPDSSGEFPLRKDHKLASVQSRSEKKQNSKKSDQYRKMPDSEKRLPDVDNLTDVAGKPKLTLTDVVNDLAQAFKVRKDSKDYSTMFLWMQILLKNTDGNNVIATKDKLIQQYSKGDISKPVGYLIKTVQEQSQTLPNPDQNHDYIPPKPCPDCRKPLTDIVCDCGWKKTNWK